MTDFVSDGKHQASDAGATVNIRYTSSPSGLWMCRYSGLKDKWLSKRFFLFVTRETHVASVLRTGHAGDGRAGDWQAQVSGAVGGGGG